MSHLRATVLHQGDVARVSDVACTAPRSGCGAEEASPRAQLIVVRRGVFAVHRGRRSLVADPTTAVVLAAGDETRFSHPADGGDRCTAITLDDATAEEALGTTSRALRLDAGAQLAAARLARRLAHDDLDPLEAEEATLTVLHAVKGARHLSRGRCQAPSTEAQALLAADPARRWRLAELGAAVGVSPFHLARSFRAATGRSVGEHLLRLRLALALDRMADGEDDLARVAVDAGFAHHSHFTARFRRVFGTTPSAARS